MDPCGSLKYVTFQTNKCWRENAAEIEYLEQVQLFLLMSIWDLIIESLNIKWKRLYPNNPFSFYYLWTYLSKIFWCDCITHLLLINCACYYIPLQFMRLFCCIITKQTLNRAFWFWILQIREVGIGGGVCCMTQLISKMYANVRNVCIGNTTKLYNRVKQGELEKMLYTVWWRNI